MIDMARESRLDVYGLGKDHLAFVDALQRFAALARADEREAWERVCDHHLRHIAKLKRQHKAGILAEREACAKVCEEFARKWWKIHCDSNLHYSSTLKAHQDFCALQAAIRARGQA
jgi:hypothetical protein